jgi:hypothetical protein
VCGPHHNTRGRSYFAAHPNAIHRNGTPSMSRAPRPRVGDRESRVFVPGRFSAKADETDGLGRLKLTQPPRSWQAKKCPYSCAEPGCFEIVSASKRVDTASRWLQTV